MPRRRLVILNWRDDAHPLRGGAELYCERVADQLGRAGEDVVLVTSRPRGVPAHEDRGSYRVVRRGGTYSVYPWSLLWLLRHRRGTDAVLDCQNGIPFFSPLVVRRGVPAVLLLHHVHQEQFSIYFGPLMAAVGRFIEGTLTRWVYGHRTVIAVSPSTRANALADLRLTGQVVVVPNGMEGSGARATAPRSTAPRIVVVGRLVTHKRLHLLLEAMPRIVGLVPGTELHVVGDGPQREELLAAVPPGLPPGSVVFHGRTSAVQRDGLLSSAWLTVCASQGEGWGLTVLEANALGVPAVAFRVPGLKDSVLPGRTGWLVDDGSSAQLGAVVVDALVALSDEEVAAAFGDRAREWAAGFTWERTAKEVRDVLRGEAGRLRRRDPERRVSKSVDTVVELPRGTAVPRAVVGGGDGLRITDRSWSVDGTTRWLLYGADGGAAARTASRLLDLDPRSAITCRQPSPEDYLGRGVSTAPLGSVITPRGDGSDG